ncbi:hypothetical protein [Rhizobium chutanense]|uniref:hypothetical protein n=1 Tax=Rhizobium chutanense TaxID=2035448 RepID=UPI000F874FE4|nr:hypothetical protein [Rhizobium chutanense]
MAAKIADANVKVNMCGGFSGFGKNGRKKPSGERAATSPADFMMNDPFIFKTESFVKFARKSLIRKASDV